MSLEEKEEKRDKEDRPAVTSLVGMRRKQMEAVTVILLCRDQWCGSQALG